MLGATQGEAKPGTFIISNTLKATPFLNVLVESFGVTTSEALRQCLTRH